MLQIKIQSMVQKYLKKIKGTKINTIEHFTVFCEKHMHFGSLGKVGCEDFET